MLINRSAGKVRCARLRIAALPHDYRQLELDRQGGAKVGGRHHLDSEAVWGRGALRVGDGHGDEILPDGIVGQLAANQPRAAVNR